MRNHTPLPNLSDDELSEEQLDEVSAGGKAITKQVDSASPKFFAQCVAGAHYASVTLN